MMYLVWTGKLTKMTYTLLKNRSQAWWRMVYPFEASYAAAAVLKIPVSSFSVSVEKKLVY